MCSFRRIDRPIFTRGRAGARRAYYAFQSASFVTAQRSNPSRLRRTGGISLAFLRQLRFLPKLLRYFKVLLSLVLWQKPLNFGKFCLAEQYYWVGDSLSYLLPHRTFLLFDEFFGPLQYESFRMERVERSTCSAKSKILFRCFWTSVFRSK
jgi:hypothetical protein